MKSMKLGAKIGLGFGILIFLALALGSVAVLNIGAIQTTAERLAREQLPQVKLASDLERNFLQAALGGTVYAYTQDSKFLDLGKKALTEARKNLDDADKLAAGSPDLATFGEETKKTRGKIDQFEQQLNEAAVKDYDLARNYGEMQETNKFFMDNANLFLSRQLDALKIGMSRGENGGKMLQQLKKVTLMNELVGLGNQILLAASTARAKRDLTPLDGIEKVFASIDAKLDAITAITHEEADLGVVKNLKTASELYKNALSELSGMWSDVQEINKQGQTTGDEIMMLTQGAHDAGLDDTKKISAQTVKKVSFSTMMMISGVLLASIIGIAIAVYIIRAITKPVRQVARGLLDGADQVASASALVTSSSLSVAEGASQQAAALEEGSASLEQISAMTHQNAEHAAQADQLMRETSTLITIASRSMNQLTSSMTDITKANEDTRKIIKTIDAVAFQTNLLALNAAVEAARAGQAGAGFAVVAEEVRNLARRSAEAAKNTADLIEHSTRQVKDGYAIVAKTTSEFTEVARSVASCEALVGEITTASREQARGIGQVSTAVLEMDKIVQQNAANAEESASASGQMNAQAEQMKGFVGELVALVGTGDNGKSKGRGSLGRRIWKNFRLVFSRKSIEQDMELQLENDPEAA